MYNPIDSLFEHDKKVKYKYISNEYIIDTLSDNAIIPNSEIYWFYNTYTQGYAIWSKEDLLRIWSVAEIKDEHIRNELRLSQNEFYFADVSIWCYGLYFKLLNDNTAEVWADYGKNGKEQLAVTVREWISKLNSNWDLGLYGINGNS